MNKMNYQKQSLGEVKVRFMENFTFSESLKKKKGKTSLRGHPKPFLTFQLINTDFDFSPGRNKRKKKTSKKSDTRNFVILWQMLSFKVYFIINQD